MKKNMFVGLVLSAAMVLIAIVLQSFTAPNFQDDPWVVPEKFINMDNPIDGQLGLGKDMYNKHCKSCHGKEGLGDGPKAEQLDTEAGDFTDEEFQEQSDGVLFYKTWTGHGDMPAFSKKMSQTEAWAVVNYLRQFE